MAERSAIEWTDASWNPLRGCQKISPGCKHCYAQTFAERFRGVPNHPFVHGFDPVLAPGKLAEPLRWSNPQRIFVNSMSDLFLENVPDAYIRRVVDVMLLANWHTYQVLTKRADRLRALLEGPLRDAAATEHIWWGVSVEDKKHGLPRIATLQNAPARVRFLSIEPLLEDLGTLDLAEIHWVIAGGESGPGARPLDAAWVRSVRDQCAAGGVPFFFKQWGGARKKEAGRRLDGLLHHAMPPLSTHPALARPERLALIARQPQQDAALVPLRRARRAGRSRTLVDGTTAAPQPCRASAEASAIEPARAEPDLTDPSEILFELQLEHRDPGSLVGGQYGTVVRCPRCERSACRIGRQRYAHTLRLVRCMTSVRGPSGEQVLVRDVRPEWRSICTAPQSIAPHIAPLHGAVP
jgi:protein gp37